MNRAWMGGACFECGGKLTSNCVGIDVVGLAFMVGSHARNHRDVALIEQGNDHRWVHLSHITHQPQRTIAMGTGLYQRSIGAAQANGPATNPVQSVDNLLVDATDQDHLNDIHGVGAGHPQALLKHRFNGEAIQPLVDLWAATMNDHRLDTDTG